MYRFGPMYEQLDHLKKNPALGKMEPFRIVGNVYFTGTYQASSHLIDTGDGLILIDTGYASTLYLLINSIWQLGFRPTDVKYVINTHWHGDHTEATAAFARLSGAKTLLGKDDLENAAPFFTPDILIHDGDTLTLGNTTVSFLHTPGHTKGTISLFFNTVEDGKTYRVGMFGGAGLNTMVRARFDFDGCREAYFSSLEKLSREHVDVFIGNHTWNNGTWEKSPAQSKADQNEFINSTLWNTFLDTYRQKLQDLIEKEV